jgi:hypothetical protein
MSYDGTQAAPLGSAAAESTGSSVLILTYNEVTNLGRCLEFLQACDAIVALDSKSSDATPHQRDWTAFCFWLSIRAFPHGLLETRLFPRSAAQCLSIP